MRAIGFKPCFFTASSLAKMTADAPSLIEEALAAVTVPSLVNAALRFGIFSNFTFLYSSSSEMIIGSPFRCGTETGTISFLNLPDSVV